MATNYFELAQQAARARRSAAAPEPAAAPPPTPGALPQSAIEGAQMEAAAMNPMERFLVGLGKGATNIIEGVGQLTGLSSPERQAQVAEGARLFEAGLGESTAATLGEIGGEIAATAVPGGLAARALGRVAPGVGASMAANPIKTAAGIGAAEGGLRFAETGEERLANIGLGAVGGGGSVAALRGAARGLNALRGQARPEVQEVIKAGQEAGVDVLGSDIAASPLVRKADVLAENVPGLSGVKRRMRQSEQAAAAAEQLQQRASQGFVDEGLTTGEAIQGSLRRELASARAGADARYRRVEELAEASDAVFSPNNATRTIQETLADAGSASAITPSTVASLQNRLAEFEDMGVRNAIQTRRRLNDEITNLYDAGRRFDARVVRQVRDAFDEDMAREMGRVGGDLAGAYKDASQFFKSQVADRFYNRSMQAAMKSEDPDTIYRTFMKNVSSVSRPRRLYNALDERGRAAVRSGMLQEAIDAATISKGSGNPVFSPARFAQVIERQSDQIKEMFPQADANQIQGFGNLMRTIERAGQVAENPPTGARLVTLGGVGGLFEPVSAANVLGSTAALRLLTNTTAGRNLLASSAELNPASPRAQRLVERALALTGGTTAQQTGEQ